MCLMLYLGTDAPVPGFVAVALGEIGLDPDTGPPPAALEADSGALIFSCWAGDEAIAPAIERVLAPDALVPARYVFDDATDGGSGGNPPVLVRLRAGEGAT